MLILTTMFAFSSTFGRVLFFCCCLFAVLTVFGQNTKAYRLPAHPGEKIIVEAPDFNYVIIRVHQKDSVFVFWESDGEYARFLNLQVTQEVNNLKISGRKTLWFPDYDDKLSAHKVIAQKLNLWVPENMTIEVYTDHASTEISGSYQWVFVRNSNGDIRLSRFTGNADLVTFEGDIEIDVSKAAIICNCPIAKADRLAPYTIKLKTTHGKTKSLNNK